MGDLWQAAWGLWNSYLLALLWGKREELIDTQVA